MYVTHSFMFSARGSAAFFLVLINTDDREREPPYCYLPYHSVYVGTKRRFFLAEARTGYPTIKRWVFEVRLPCMFRRLLSNKQTETRAPLLESGALETKPIVPKSGMMIGMVFNGKQTQGPLAQPHQHKNKSHQDILLISPRPHLSTSEFLRQVENK